MPTIAEAADHLLATGHPALCVDTCIVLDIIRAPLRKIEGCVQAAVNLMDLVKQNRCTIIASSRIRHEWNNHRAGVCEEAEEHVQKWLDDASAFREACELIHNPISLGAHSNISVLITKLEELASAVIDAAIHLTQDAESASRATHRALAHIRPAQKGKGLEDCIVIEEYFELSRCLKVRGFTAKRVFCTSNRNDYQDGVRLHAALSQEFADVGLTYTNSLDWAVAELKKP